MTPSDCSNLHDGSAWTLRRRLGAAFAAVAVLLVLLTTVTLLAMAKFVSASNEVIVRWQPAAAASQQVLDDLVNQETGVRGYALTGQSRYLQPYRTYRAQQLRDTARARSLLTGEPELLVRLGNLQAAAADWQRVTVTTMVRNAARHVASPLTAFDDGKRRFDRIRARAATFNTDVGRRVTSAQRARSRDERFAVLTGSIAALVVAVSGFVLWRGLHRWVLGPVDRLGTQTRDVASGNTHRKIAGDGPRELTGLAGDVEAMRLQIAGELARAERIQEELRVQGAELARSNDDLQQFAYVASHDLSEPLRKVANFCQLLERQYADHLDDRARRYIHFAVDGAKRMQVLITDLLALSRVGRSTDTFVATQLDTELDAALATLRDTIAATGARIERRTPLPTVDGDHALLVSLFENLVGNAIKYRRADVAPDVCISAEHDPDARCWVITVSDNGIGIDPQYAERIFVVFQRLHLRDQYGGTGIGLALCRRIVEFHGGRIWLAEAQTPPGATFRSPFQRVRNVPNHLIDQPRPPLGVLLVEDDPGDVLIAEEALKASELTPRLTVVSDGVEALAYLRREGGYADAERPDLILLDLNLPRKSGHEVLAEVKADPVLRRIPIVVLTTSGASEDVERSYDLHANVFVTKPVDFDQFTRVIKQIDDFFLTVAQLPPTA